MDNNKVILRVAHFPQVPCKAFYVEGIKDVHDAKKVMDMLANYDMFQYENNIKPDYANASFLERWYADGEKDGEWEDWIDDETGIDNVDEYIEYLEEELK